ncbi:unnamed protein product [Adineta steineri]|uniref:Uncharacterized protein n=1 Tax=Adineta steineri TaxID=433720 RepID=A0A814V5B8_9BILA|nr:unnamed protein product [Adineta steineri]
MSVDYQRNPQGPPPGYHQPYPSNYPQQAPPVFTQPYPVHNQPIIIHQQQNKDVQHGCHFLLWFLTGGLWTPCWIAACSGCCK